MHIIDYTSKADAQTDAATDVYNILESRRMYTTYRNQEEGTQHIAIEKNVHETAYRNQAECTQHTGIKKKVHSIQESRRMYNEQCTGIKKNVCNTEESRRGCMQRKKAELVH